MVNTRTLFLQHLAQTTDFPLLLDIHRAKGVYLFGPGKKKYIDLISGISVSSVGHLHPHVVKALKKQLRKHLHVMVYGELAQSPQVRLGKILSDTLPDPLDNVYLVNSGSEAIEGAMKLAKRATGRSEIISCYNAYHGSTQGALSVSGSEVFKQAYRPLLPDIKHLHFGCMGGIRQISHKTAAVIIETVQGEAGVQEATDEYWQLLRKKCTETGTLLILDEIQTGMGRTGKMWGFEHYGIIPDILVTAKGLGGGMPIGAFISSKELMQELSRKPILGHITTFGGHPMSAAAAVATLEILMGRTNENLIAEVEQKAEYLKGLLKHEKILNIRNKGLLMAAEMSSFERLKPAIDRAIEKGLLTDWFLYCDNAMRISPPLIIQEKELRKAARIILEAVDHMA